MKQKPWLNEEPSKEYKDKVMNMAMEELAKNKASQGTSFFRRFFLAQIGVMGLVGFGLWRIINKKSNVADELPAVDIVKAISQTEVIQLVESGVETEEELDILSDLELIADIEILEEWGAES